MCKEQSDRELQFSQFSDIGQSFAPIGLHKNNASSDWLLIKQHYHGKKGLPGVKVQKLSDYISYRRHFIIYRKEEVLFQPKIRGASEKFKNQPQPLLRPRFVNFRQHLQNLSHKTVPLMYGKPAMTCLKYQVYLYGSEAITYLKTIL
jgi:hypothetical protein